MIAEIYPITRMPRRFGFFDYAIPEGMTVHVGDVVRAPLRGRRILGVVRKIKDTSEYERLSSVDEVMAPKLFDRADVERLETIAQAIFQAPSSVFDAALQGWKPMQGELNLRTGSRTRQSITTSEASFIRVPIETRMKPGPLSIQASSELEAALVQILRKQTSGQILVLCPSERQAELMLEYAATQPSIVLHGKTRGTERRAIIDAWRNGEIKLLIGTRQAALLPANKIDLVIVTDSGCEDYFMLDRNPRIDSRAAARLLAKQHGAKIIFTGPLPRLEEFADPAWQTTFYSSPSALIVPLAAQEEKTGIPFLTERLAKAIETNRRRTLILYNKKGVAQRLQCASCGHIPFCGTCKAVPSIRLTDLVCGVCKTEMWIPKQCPACGSDKLKQKGIGNQLLARSFAKRFPGKSVAIIDKEHPTNRSGDILIVTEHYFANLWLPFSKPEFGVVADVAFDLSLTGKDFRAAEQAAYRLHRLLFFASQQRASAIIQTWMPDTVSAMLTTKPWLQGELETRKTYELPPTTAQYEMLDKSGKITYKSMPDHFTDLPDSTIINVDTITYDRVPDSQKSKPPTAPGFESSH